MEVQPNVEVALLHIAPWLWTMRTLEVLMNSSPWNRT